MVNKLILGIMNVAHVKWIKHWLKGRLQKGTVPEKQLYSGGVSSEVLQRSVLGLLLFYFSVNDLEDHSI